MEHRLMADMALAWRGFLLGLLISIPFALAACTHGSWGVVNPEIWKMANLLILVMFKSAIHEVPALHVLVLEAFSS